MKRNLMNILGIILIGIGTFVFLSPVFSSYKQQKNADQEIEAFENFEKEKKVPKEKDPLYKEAIQYNQKIYTEGQKNLKDVWSYRTSPIELKDWIYQDKKDGCKTSIIPWSNFRKYEERCCNHGRDIPAAWYKKQ